MKQSIRAVRILACVVLLLFCFVVESALGIRVSFFGAHLDFMPPIIAASALCLGCPAGMVCGFLAGMLYDITGTGIEGLYPIYYMLWGITCGLIGESPSAKRYRLRMSIALSLSIFIVLSFIRYLFYFQFIAETSLVYVVQNLGIQAFLTIILCVPIYAIVVHISGINGNDRRKRQRRRERTDEYEERS